jgi:hypothetical protein
MPKSHENTGRKLSIAVSRKKIGGGRAKLVSNKAQFAPISKFSVYVWYKHYVDSAGTGEISLWPFAIEADVGRQQQAFAPSLKRRLDALHGNLPFLSRQFRKRLGSACN